MQAMIVTAPAAQSAVEASTLSAIAGACRDQETLRFRYCDYAGATTARVVEPHRLVHTGRRWYLVAWDTNREDWRTFRVDRIQPRMSTGARFDARQPPARDLAAYVARGASFSALPRVRIKMLASAEVVSKRLPPGVGTVEPCDGDACFLEVGAGSYESLAMHLVLLGVDFEVTEPEEFVREVRRIAERYQRAIS
jgi:predicted DNA-binding transcriptional regulator YafY